MIFQSINPATGEVIARYGAADDREVEATLARAQAAFETWRRSTHAERAGVLQQMADAIEADEKGLSELITLEMGKPIAQALAEVRKCATLCRHYAEHGAAYLAPEEVRHAQGRAIIVPEPLGVIFSVTPWNFPCWQLVRLAVPAIAAGNAVVVKPAPNVLGSALRLVDALMQRSDAPDGLYQVLCIDHEQAERVIADDRIAAAGLTGSERAGAAVAATAGGNLKKVVLELGGSDPYLVLADADVEKAAKVAAVARFQNTGQVCIAAKRIFVARQVRDDFIDVFLREVDAMKLGNPMDPQVYIGPMAREDLRDGLHRQTREAIAAGARVIRAGGPVEGPGYFYAPTVLEGGDSGNPYLVDEIFGPAVVVLEGEDEESMIRAANASRFGLSASVWTQDPGRARRVAAEIQTGNVFINDMSRTDPAYPVGGIKRSGFGRELGRDGTREFCNIKTVVIPE